MKSRCVVCSEEYDGDDHHCSAKAERLYVDRLKSYQIREEKKCGERETRSVVDRMEEGFSYLGDDY